MKNGRVISALLLFVGLVVGYLFAQTLDNERVFHGVPINPFKIGTSARMGAIYGARLSIPAHYLYFPVEYEGDDSWKPSKNKPERTADSEIRAFSVYVQLPDLKPRSPENEASFQQSFKGTGVHDWVMIGVQRSDKTPLTAEQAKFGSNGLGRVAARALTIFDANNSRRDKDIPANVHFEIEPDQLLGLTVATPIGTGTNKPAIWNDQLYWVGTPGEEVNTFIKCFSKNYTTKNNPGNCTHEFYVPELNARISVIYKKSHLPQWREIEAKSRKLLLSFRTLK
ncbi:MAG: hypothetical protein KA535_04745 [Azonexus sp.]|nr:hypothetical protein [Azonexus sp.]